MKPYRIIEANRIPGGTFWTLVRQESDTVTDLLPFGAHESLTSAEAAKAGCEQRDEKLLLRYCVNGKKLTKNCVAYGVSACWTTPPP